MKICLKGFRRRAFYDIKIEYPSGDNNRGDKRNHFMKKKILTAVTALMLAGVLAACGNQNTQEAEEGTEESANEASDETADAAGTEADEGAAEGETGTEALVYLSDFDLKDYVTLGEYKGIEIAVEEPDEVSEEYLDTYIKMILSYDAVATEVTGRSVESGDIVNIDYEGKMDGVAFAGGTAQGADLTIGSGSFIDGFEDGIIGMEIGETRDLNLNFPDPYQNNPDLAGKAVVFTVTLNSISVSEVPELTDEYVAALGIEDCSTAEDFRNRMFEILTEQAQASYENEKMSAALEAAEANAEFKEIPSGLLNRLSGVLSGEQAEQMARRYMLVGAVADAEGIEVTDEELEAKLAEESADYAYYGFTSEEEYRQNIDEEAYREYLLAQKVSDFLVENAVLSSGDAE